MRENEKGIASGDESYTNSVTTGHEWDTASWRGSLTRVIDHGVVVVSYIELVVELWDQ